MLQYFCTALGLSLISLSLVFVLKSVPSRVRLYCLLFGVVSWLVPWSLLKFSYRDVPVLSESATLLVSNSTVTKSVTTLNAGMKNVDFPVLEILLFIGFLLFMLDLFRHKLSLIRFHQASESADYLWKEGNLPTHNYSLRILPGLNNAFTSGLFRPTIWLGPEFTQRNVILHEVAHIKHYDNWLLFMLRFTQCLFWWNPVVHVKVRLAQRLIEMSCDEYCQNMDVHYRTDLATLLVRSYPIEAKGLVLGMSLGKSFDLKRIVHLGESIQMKVKNRHKLIIVLAVIFSFFAISLPVISSGIHSEERYRLVVIDSHGEFAFHWEEELADRDILERLLELAKDSRLQYNTSFSDEHQIMEHKFVTQSEDFRDALLAISRENEKRRLASFGFKADEVLDEAEPDMALDIQFTVVINDGEEQKVSLIGTEKQWSGIQHDNYIIRINPTVSDENIFINVKVEERNPGEVRMVHKHRLITRFGETASWVYQHDGQADKMAISLLIDSTKS